MKILTEWILKYGNGEKVSQGGVDYQIILHMTLVFDLSQLRF